MLLVVEDDTDMMRALLRALSALGYQVLEAATFEAAAAILRADAPVVDVLLTDVVLPDGNGCRLGADARALHPDLPVFYMSGYGRDILVRYGNADPAAEFVHKPFSALDLRHRIQVSLAARRVTS